MYIKYILHVKIYRKWNITILPWIQQTQYVLIKKKKKSISAIKFNH